MIFSEDSLTVDFISVENILLDIFNPRFAGDNKAPKFSDDTQFGDFQAQEITRRYLIEKQGANSLVESISRVGFLKLDRMVVQEFSPNNYVVVEGNRRLAAIKTLIGNVKRRIVVLPTSIIEKLTKIEVLVLQRPGNGCDDTALLLQGLRHISGVKNWGPYQQGKLIYSLVQNHRMNFSEVGLAVGLSPGRVSTLLRSYCGLKQMECNPEFCTTADAGLFSCFEQAYVKLPVRNWLGWSEQDKGYTNSKALHFFYSQIAYNNAGPAIIAREIRDLLPAVLGDGEARAAYLEEGVSLRDAYKQSHPHKEHLGTFLKNALGGVRLLKGQELSLNEREFLQEIHLLAGQILQK